MPLRSFTLRAPWWCVGVGLLFTSAAHAQDDAHSTLAVQVVECEPVNRRIVEVFRWRQRRAERRYQRRLKRRPDEEHQLEHVEPPAMVPETDLTFVIPGVGVTLSGDAEAGCVSDREGLCYFTGLAAGSYDVTASIGDHLPNRLIGVPLGEMESKTVTVCILLEQTDTDMELIITQRGFGASQTASAAMNRGQ